MTTPVSARCSRGTDLANKGVINVDALQFAMPSVTVNNFGQGIDFNVRGIGKAEHNTQTTTGVITYRDGVPTFPGYFQGEPYYDIANIQVLRGPQGTIVGQNATGGAVFVNTNDPIIGGGVHGYVQAQYGNYNDVGAAGRDQPADQRHLRGAGRLLRRAARQLLQHHRPGRRALYRQQWRPAHGCRPAQPAVEADRPVLDPVEDRRRLSRLRRLSGDALLAASRRCRTAPPNPRYAISSTSPPTRRSDARDKFVRSILKIDYDTRQRHQVPLGHRLPERQHRLPRRPGRHRVDRNPITSDRAPILRQRRRDGSSARNSTSSRLTTSASPGCSARSALWNNYTFPALRNFVIDACYPAKRLRRRATIGCRARNPERSLAVFGQVGFNITPNLQARGRRALHRQPLDQPCRRSCNTALLYPRRADRRSRTISPTRSRWAGRSTPTNYLYGFVATGFRPGGLNVPVGLGLPAPFGPEKVTSYEAGWKANFAGGHIRTTLDGFYNDYKNFQVIIGYPTFPTFGIELNVPDTHQDLRRSKPRPSSSSAASRSMPASTCCTASSAQFYATDPRIGDRRRPATRSRGPAERHLHQPEGPRARPTRRTSPSTSARSTTSRSATATSSRRALNFGHVGAQWATLFENRGARRPARDRNILNAQLAWQHGTWTVTGLRHQPHRPALCRRAQQRASTSPGRRASTASSC